ncbi:MAG: adenylate/guanylate cyclase domain-containing protein, partial [Candidatus Dormibacteria bacterium]
FTDIVNSTAMAARIGDQAWRSRLEQHDALASEDIERHEGRLIKSLGDGVMAAFDRPALAIRCARALQSRVADMGLQLRAGIHAGECELTAGDVTGIAVHVGARIAALADPGEVLVSSTVRDLVMGSGIDFTGRGSYVLKGVSGEWQLYAVATDVSRDQSPAASAPSAEASLTPAPSAAMTTFDRALLRLAASTPGLTRAALRVAARRKRR